MDSPAGIPGRWAAGFKRRGKSRSVRRGTNPTGNSLYIGREACGMPVTYPEESSIRPKLENTLPRRLDGPDAIPAVGFLGSGSAPVVEH